MRDTLHQLSPALTDSTLLPSKPNCWSLNLGYLFGTLGFLFVLTALMIVMRREGLGFADFFP